MDVVDFVFTIWAALLMGVAIGLERQARKNPAGLRTNALVCVGAALFVSLSVLMDDQDSPTRMASYVVSGVGFLGGGIILRDGLNVKGIDTAATLWCSAAVGTLVGSGFVLHGLAATLTVLALNLVLRPLARWLDTWFRTATDMEAPGCPCRSSARGRKPVEASVDQLWLWVGFNAFVLAMLALDLGVFHRSAHEVSIKEAAAWSVAWVALALAFNGGVFYFMGEQPALEFLAGYLIEKALSVDNIFVFVLIFSYFRVPPKYQHRILFWGILGALIMRGVMIGLGAYLIHRFHWILYLFGAFLVWTGYRMARQDEQAIEPEANPVLRLIRRFVPITNTYHGQSFFTREPAGSEGGLRRVATPLFVVLVLIETTDLIFAVDSIPAIFAVTQDPFLVYSSNVFAILGLRALYFLLSGVIGKFRYLKFGLSVVLIFVGAKMLLADVYKIPIGLSLGIIALVIVASVVISLLSATRTEVPPPPSAVDGSDSVQAPENAPDVSTGTAGRPPGEGPRQDT